MADSVLRGGQEGYARLAVLGEERWADTAALLARAGVAAGQRCVDLGCGGGEVTIALATLVAPGEVVGVDMDAAMIALAADAAAARGVRNVCFEARDVGDWDEPDAYDVVYSRFVLQHLREPRDLLARMWAAVRPDGVLVVEDADHEGWCGHPTNAGLTFFVRTFCEALRRRGGDPTVGRKLFQCFGDVGAAPEDVRVVQSVHLDGDAKSLAWSTLAMAKEAIVAEEVAPPEAVDDALASLRRYTDDPRSLICSPRIFQLFAHRPSAT